MSGLSAASALTVVGHEKRMPFEQREIMQRSGLRVYVSPVGGVMPGGLGVFYSRREGGPYYSWRFDEKPGRWRSCRVHPSVLGLKGLCVASWKVVPHALRARLDEHYLE
jgi:hypothetical protein